MTRGAKRPRGGMALLVSAGVLLAAASARAGEAGREGPVSFWTFDGSLEDAAGESRDNLVGRDALYLAAPSSPDVRLGASYTIAAWIHPTALGKWDRLVLCWGEGYAYHLAIHDGSLSLYHGPASGKPLFAEGGRIRTGRWYHVAGVARRNSTDPSKSRLEVYLDGKLTASAPFDGTIRVLPREGLGVGDSGGKLPGTHHFRGYIDELAVWNRALDPADIRAHYEKRAALLRGLGLDRRKAEADRRAGRFAGLMKLGVEEVIFAERHPGRDLSGHYYANFGYSCTDPNYWLHGRDGGRLSKLNVRTGEVTALVDDPGGAVRDPQVHYDAKKILFSYRKGGGHNYNLHEINIDGTGLRRITSGAWDDVEPAYLPDGGIVFCSTRCKRYIGCWLAPSAILFRCDADGGNIRMLSSGAFTENTPAVLPDGRVLYTRWEYVNRDPVVFHHLWTMNPDGTAQMVYFGNMHPGGVFIDAKPIPGTERVAFIHSPAHGRNEHAGWLATVTDRQGPDAKSSMRHVTRGNDFRDPWPLSEDAFLVARGKQVLLVDSRGNAEVLHAGSGMVHEPCAVIKRPRERTVPPRVDATMTTGEVILTDVYFGRNMAGVKRGAIKKLLVLEDLPKPANFHGGGSQPIGHGVTSTLKRILGTVPVEPDGSAYFRVPAMRSVYFAALDANDLSVKQMRSFVTLQPGEIASCLGCHEDRTKSPASGRRKLRALRRGPSDIEPVRDVPGVIDFPRDVQPVLDRHCVKCHNHEKRKGGVVLAGDRGPVFSRSYYMLLLHWQVKDTTGNPGNGSGRQKGNDKPYSTYSSASPLMKRIDGGHSKVRLAPRERSCDPALDRHLGAVRRDLRGARHGPGGRLLGQQQARSRHGRQVAVDRAGEGRHPETLRLVSRADAAEARHGQDPVVARGYAVLGEADEPVLAASGLQPEPAGEVARSPGAARAQLGRVRRGQARPQAGEGGQAAAAEARHACGHLRRRERSGLREDPRSRPLGEGEAGGDQAVRHARLQAQRALRPRDEALRRPARVVQFGEGPDRLLRDRHEVLGVVLVSARGEGLGD